MYPVIITVAWLVWHLLFRIQVIGKENLKKIQSPGFILAPTHISAIDPVFIAIARFWGKRMVVFGKKELFEINPVITWFLGQCGCVMVRGTKDEMETLNNTIEECKKGRGLLLFPEGTREKEGKLLPPKSGLFVVAAGAGPAGGGGDIDRGRPDPEAVQRLLEQDAHMCKFHPAKTSRV